jgi:predicted dehydrogenase
MQRLNLVFLGCGEVAAAHSRRLARHRDEVRCFYASREPERAMAFERRFGGGGSFGSYQAALEDGRMDAVLVATPPQLHLELTLAALAHGKDVIVEKPAFLRASDCEIVESARARAGRRVLVAENYCYKPLAFVLRSLLAAGAVGEPRFVQVNACKSQPSAGWRDEPTLAGGGALLEGGVHWIDLVAHLGPRVVAVHGHRPGPAAGPERSMLVVLEYEGGGIGTLSHSWETPSALHGLQLSRIRGTEGSIVFESNGLAVSVWGRTRRLILPGLADLQGYGAMFRDFLAALRGERAPLMTLERARAGLAIVEAAYRGAGSAANQVAERGGEHGTVDRVADWARCRGAHLDLGHVQGQPA